MTPNDERDPGAVRAATEDELDALAGVWHDAWHEAHAALVAPELTRLRTRESFVPRLRRMTPRLRVAGPLGAPLGLCIIHDDELEHLFVAAAARGTGVAAALLDDGERRLAASGVATAWLACAIGNERAARFYEKRGWSRAGTMVNVAETEQGGFPLEVWRYEKRVGG